MKRVLVFLSAYNGEKYIGQLLDSLLSQQAIELTVHIRDDGSEDLTPSIIKDYAAKYSNIEYELCDNVGYAKSFWSVFKLNNEFDFYAFCDQDDIWQPEKLIRAIELLEKENSQIPLLYTSNVVSVDNNFNVLTTKTFDIDGTISFYQSLQKSVLPGCTFVFNCVAFDYLSRYNGYMESHDWATYCIISALGKVVYDPNSYIFYRVHNGNIIGKPSKMKELWVKIKRFFRPSKRSRSKFAKDFYECYKDCLNEEYAYAAKLLGYYRENKMKMTLLRDKHFNGFTFKLMVLFGKV